MFRKRVVSVIKSPLENELSEIAAKMILRDATIPTHIKIKIRDSLFSRKSYFETTDHHLMRCRFTPREALILNSVKLH